MITFLICLALLVSAYFVYGSYLERVSNVNADTLVPSSSSYDGVDYIPLPLWKTFLIQLLNIAGLGPIFGAVLGAAFGPVAFLWITFGAIFMGGVHDFIAGVISVKSNGASLPESIGEYLGGGVKLFMRIFSVLLMLLVGAVFVSQPATLIANRLDIPALSGVAFGNFSWILIIIIAIILIYYIFATLLPIDKIIGKIYPIFGFALLFMAFGILIVLLFDSKYTIPEFTSFTNQISNFEDFPIMPMLFTTIACGAMISEGIIALIWAAIAMAFWGGVDGLNGAIAEYKGQAAILVDVIATDTLGGVLASFVIFGVVACAITSGDTAFRSARLIIADFLNIEQISLRKRIYISLPLFLGACLIIFCLPFGAIWSYFAWTNQSLAAITLWMITSYLYSNGKNYVVSLLPAMIMTYVCVSYIFVSPLMINLSNRSLSYLISGILTLLILVIMIRVLRRLKIKKLNRL